MSDNEYGRKLHEFSKTEPEVAIGLIEELHKKRDEHYKLLLKLNDFGKIIYDSLKGKRNVIKIIKLDEKKYMNKPLAGIDGSMYVTGGRGKRYYTFISAVIVLIKRGLVSQKDEIEILYPRDCIKVEAFDDPSLGEEVWKIAEDIMFYYETKALYEINHLCLSQGDCYYTFIDGPIIDPPRQLSEYGNKFIREKLKSDRLVSIEEANIDYTTYRVTPIVDAWELRYKKHYIVGYVKSTRTEQLLTKELANMGVNKDLLSAFTGDDELAYMILKNAVEYEQNYAYIGPFKVNYDDSKLEYMKPYLEKGIEIYYIYGINRWHNKVFRLEIGAPKETSYDEISRIFDDIYRLTISVTLPGNVHPLPVVIAHEKCKIRPGAAELIYELLLSGVHLEILRSSEIKDNERLAILNLLRDVIEKH